MMSRSWQAHQPTAPVQQKLIYDDKVKNQQPQSKTKQQQTKNPIFLISSLYYIVLDNFEDIIPPLVDLSSRYNSTN